MTVFLLGPSRNDAGESAPLELRRSLAERMWATGTRAVVMEDHADRPGENNLAKFQRIIQDEDVRTFALAVPLKARLHGVSVEIGHILTRIQDGRLDAARVHLILQALLADVEDDGVLALAEPGNRTRYYEDLIDEGCPLHRWVSLKDLNWHMVAIAIENDALIGRA